MSEKPSKLMRQVPVAKPSFSTAATPTSQKPYDWEEVTARREFAAMDRAFKEFKKASPKKPPSSQAKP